MGLDIEQLTNALVITGLSKTVDPAKMENAFLSTKDGGICLTWIEEGGKNRHDVDLKRGIYDAVELMRVGIGYSINGEVKKNCKFETYMVGGCEVYR